MITIPLTQDQWRYLLMVLVQQPYKDVAPLVQTIAQALDAANQPAPPPPPPAAAPDGAPAA